jgi:hypothetical protein
VVSFGWRALVAVVMSLGLAALDLGPRASAAFVSGVSVPPSANCDSSGVGSSGAADSRPDFRILFPAPNEGQPIQWAQNVAGNSPPGGAGSPSSGSTNGPTGNVFNLVAAVQFARPALVTRLRLLQAVFVPHLPADSIFEPPRSGS